MKVYELLSKVFSPKQKRTPKYIAFTKSYGEEVDKCIKNMKKCNRNYNLSGVVYEFARIFNEAFEKRQKNVNVISVPIIIKDLRHDADD